jgi:uncharacterized cupin superfamily protein
VDELLIANLASVPTRSHPRRASILAIEPEGVHWPDTGVNVRVLQPGQPSGRYHNEPVQEDFLVLHGECIAILDGVEAPLKAWDFVHCPAGVSHVFVGGGEGPCALLMIGSRRLEETHYPVDATAAAYGASVSVATDDPAEAYADWRREPWSSVPNPWPSITEPR